MNNREDPGREFEDPKTYVWPVEFPLAAFARIPTVLLTMFATAMSSPPIAIHVRYRQRGRLVAGGECLLRLEGAVAVPQEDADRSVGEAGRSARVGDDQILSAVTVHVGHFEVAGIWTGREGLRAGKSAVAITKEHAQVGIRETRAGAKSAFSVGVEIPDCDRSPADPCEAPDPLETFRPRSPATPRCRSSRREQPDPALPSPLKSAIAARCRFEPGKEIRGG